MGGGASAVGVASSPADVIDLAGRVEGCSITAVGPWSQPPEAIKEGRTSPSLLFGKGLAQRACFRQPQQPELPGSCSEEEPPRDDASGSRGDGVALEATPPPRPAIVQDPTVLQRYTLGSEVMPSWNPDMQVRFAVRQADGLRVVMKVRGKRGSFVDAREEQVWRKTTETMLSLPDSPTRAKLLEVCEDAYRYYIVMERVAGQDLFQLVEGSGCPSVAQTRVLLKQILEAVAEMHMRGLIHKDLKLDNIVVERPTKPEATEEVPTESTIAPSEAGAPPALKLVDFDTVGVYSPKEARVARSITGTDQYIPQEAYGGTYSPASDMFAVGVMAYRMLTGAFPFRHDTFDDEAGENYVGSPKMQEIQRRLRSYRVDFDHPVFAEVPAAQSLCRSLLAVEPQSRPSAAEALRHPFLAPASATSSKKLRGWLPFRR